MKIQSTWTATPGLWLGTFLILCVSPTWGAAEKEAAAESEPAPQRIVSLLPSFTEMLFAVGAGEQVVAVTKFCTYPAEAASRAQIGGYVPSSMSFEQIVALRPDLVIAAGDFQQPAIEHLRALGLRVEPVVARDVAGVVEGIRQVGRLVGRTQSAERVVTELGRQIEDVKALYGDLPKAQRPRVFYEVWHDPLMTAGRRSFISELIEMAGGHSLFHDTDREYFQVSFEEVVVRRPEVILGAEIKGGMGNLDQLSELPGWRDLPAVQQGRVHPIDGDLVSRPGPRLGELLRRIAALLHNRQPAHPPVANSASSSSPPASL